MSQQLTDLQNAVAALEAEDDIVLTAIVSAVTELQTLSQQVSALGGNANTDALEGLATRVSAVSAKLAGAVQQLAAAYAPVATTTTPPPVSTPTSTPDPTPISTPATPAPSIDPAPTAPPTQ